MAKTVSLDTDALAKEKLHRAFCEELVPMQDSMESPRANNERKNVPLSQSALKQVGSNNSVDNTVMDQTVVDPQEYLSLQNTFKVSNLVRPKHYRTSKRLQDLQ